MKNLKLSIIAMLFEMAVLFTQSFAQTADSDGDGVNDSEDLCVTVKGTKANKGCPEKAKQPEQNLSVSEADLFKLQVAYVEEIGARDSKYKKLAEQYSTKATSKVKRENLESRKTEMTEIKQIATKVLADYGNKISVSSKKFFTERLEDAEYKLKLINTQLEIVALDEKDTSSALGDDFLDKVITSPKPQVKTETAIKTAKELNPNNEGQELFDAIHSNNTALVLELIKKGVNLYHQGEDTQHYRVIEVSLSLAVVRNNQTVVKAMLSAGAYPDLQVTTTDATALTEAIRNGIFEMAEVLVSAKANVNLQTKTGWTPLIHAAFIGRDTKLIRLLLDNGADPNVYTDTGYSALSHALRNKDKTFANLLAPVSSEENKIRSEKKLAEDLEWLAKNNADEAKQKAVDLENRKQESQSKNEAKAEEALREYPKLKESVDYNMKRHNEAVAKYNRAGKEAQIFYKGTFAEMHQTLRNVDKLITDYLAKHEKYIPVETLRDLKSLQAKARSGPVYQDAPR